jgi:hypothetical protein
MRRMYQIMESASNDWTVEEDIPELHESRSFHFGAGEDVKRIPLIGVNCLAPKA